MAMFDGRQNEVEISALLDTLIYLDANLLTKDFTHPRQKTVSEIVEELDKRRSRDEITLPDYFDQIKSIVENNEAYDYIKLVSGSESEGFPMTELIAASFVDTRSNDVYIAFRGTGDGKWPVNAEGMTEEMSVLQENALEYAQKVLDKYHKKAENIIATGHSQGGNLAQYITMFLAEQDEKYKISHCYSFDGQGHSKEALDKLRQLCEENNWSYEEIIRKMYSINGENDYVHDLGIVIIPEENTFFVTTPDAEGFGDFHAIEFMLNDKGLNWVRDENGEITQGTQQAIGKLAKLLSADMMEMDYDALAATAYSIMSLLERFMTYDQNDAFHMLFKDGDGNFFIDFTKGTVGKQLFVSEEQWQLFLKEGLPTVFNALNNNPDLVKGILSYLKVDSPAIQTIIDALSKLDTEQMGIILNNISAIISMVPPDVLAQATEAMILRGEPIDFKMMLKSLTPEQWKELCETRLPELIGIIRDNPELTNEVLKSFGIDIPPWLISAGSEILSDLISWLPSNVAGDFLAGLVSGEPAALPAAIELAMSVLPALNAAICKQLVYLTVDAIKQKAQAITEKLNDIIVNGAELVGEGVKAFADFSVNLINGAISAISGFSHICRQFLTNTLEAFELSAPPWLEDAFINVEKFIAYVDNAVQKSTEMCKNLLNSFKDGLNNLVCNVVSVTSDAVNAVGGFINGLIGKTADFTKKLTNEVCDFGANIIKSARELSWEAGKFLSKAAAEAYDNVKLFVKHVKDLTVTVKDSIEQMVELASSASVVVGNEIAKTVDKIKIWTADFLSGLDNLIKQGIEFVREKVTEFFNKVKGAIDGAVTFLSNVSEGVKNLIAGAATVVADKVSREAGSIVTVAQNVFGELKTRIENTVNVVINAFISAKDKVTEIAESIMADLSSAVRDVVLGQKVAWKEKLYDTVSKLEAFVNEFEANMSDLIIVSIGEVNNTFLDFKIESKKLSPNNNLNIKHRAEAISISGGGASIGSAYGSLNNGKIAVNLADLRKVKREAEDLLREIAERVKITSRARSVANDSMGEYSQSYVISDGNAVINECSKLEADTNKAREEVTSLIRGLATVIDGYIKLEREFS